MNKQNPMAIIVEHPKDTHPPQKQYLLNNSLHKRRQCQDLCWDALKNITIEPSVFLFAIMYMVTMFTSQNLSLDKACRVNLNLTDKICTNLRRQEIKGQTKYEVDTQRLFAYAASWRTYLAATIPALMSLFVGTWSDKTGRRKIFLVVGIIGQILISINDLLQTYFFYELDIFFLTFSDAIFYCFGGGWCFFLLSSYSYISALTNKETRTFRIGIFHCCNNVGFLIGSALGGVLLKNFGYYGCYGSTLTINTINLLYIIFCIKDLKRNEKQKQYDNQGIWDILRSFFDFSIARQILAILLKKRPNKTRLRIRFLLSVVFVIYGPYHGEYTFVYMITRYKFKWDELQFSLFQTYNGTVHTIGIISSLALFSKIWKWNDSLVGILAGLSKIAAAIVYTLAPNGTMFYLGSLLDMLNGLALLIVRSIISKTVNPDEIGKAMSLITLIENLSPLMFIPLYSKIYVATMEVMTGALYLVGAVLILPVIAVFCWIYYEHKKTLKTPDIKNEVEIIPLNN